MASLLFVLISLRLRLGEGAATIPGTAAKDKIVEIHNSYRCSMCNTPPLMWDDSIAQNAKDYMDTGAASGHCPSSDGSISGCVGNGENMYSGTAGDDAFEWERAINMWFASEIDCYNFDDGSNTCVAGHMTQVAWDASTKIGCASNDGATGSMKTLCMYAPPGNYAGQYTSHVHKCPEQKNFEYYTGAASCCSGPADVCKNGMCGWEYAKATTTTGCPADPGCSIHASCPGSTTASTPTPAGTPTPASTPTPAPTPANSSDTSTEASDAPSRSYLVFTAVAVAVHLLVVS